MLLFSLCWPDLPFRTQQEGCLLMGEEALGRLLEDEYLAARNEECGRLYCSEVAEGRE